ncbi:MAG: metalloregulator ArsR/SmtB family transcription factor [Rhodobacteraceae bacterium]|nr:metalloregulator ArsR/SmtB family transcription factor [Paracoccaceae bacterium]
MPERAVQEAFRALADPSRRDILRRLSGGEMTVAEVAAPLPMTRAAVKKHLDILEAANLVSAHAAGRTRLNRLEPEALRAVSDWIGYFERFWDARLAALQAAVAAEEEERMLNSTITRAVEPTIAKTVYFAAEPARVWPFLVEKDKLGQWLHRAEADLAVGRDFALLRGEGEDARRVCWGRVLEMDPPHRMRTTFTVNALEGLETVVTYALEAVAGGTRLTLTHEGLGAAGDKALVQLMAFDGGWDRHFAELRAALAAAAETNREGE